MGPFLFLPCSATGEKVPPVCRGLATPEYLVHSIAWQPYFPDRFKKSYDLMDYFAFSSCWGLSVTLTCSFLHPKWKRKFTLISKEQKLINDGFLSLIFYLIFKDSVTSPQILKGIIGSEYKNWELRHKYLCDPRHEVTLGDIWFQLPPLKKSGN